MKPIHVKLIVRAYDANGYHKDILVQDEQQVHINDTRIYFYNKGMMIDPKDLPEMVRFEVILEKVYT